MLLEIGDKTYSDEGVKIFEIGVTDLDDPVTNNRMARDVFNTVKDIVLNSRDENPFAEIERRRFFLAKAFHVIRDHAGRISAKSKKIRSAGRWVSGKVGVGIKLHNARLEEEYKDLLLKGLYNALWKQSCIVTHVTEHCFQCFFHDRQQLIQATKYKLLGIRNIRWIFDESDETIEKVLKAIEKTCDPQSHSVTDVVDKVSAAREALKLYDRRWSHITGHPHPRLEFPSIWPIHSLVRLSQGKRLNIAEKRLLKRFVKKLNGKPEITHKNLLDSLKLFEEQCNSDVYAFNLALALRDRGCKVLSERDKEHYSWASALEEGHTITCGSEEYILGEKCTFDDAEQPYREFSLEGDDFGSVKVFLNNFLEASIFKRKYLNSWEEVLTPEVKYCRDGMIVYEKLGERLGDISWDATTCNFSDKDHSRIEAIDPVVKLCLQKGKMPEDMLEGRFTIDGDKVKFGALEMEGLDYIAMEKALWQACSGNKYVFLRLMKPTKMHDQPIKKKSIKTLFHGAFEAAIENKSFNVEFEVISTLHDQKSADRMKGSVRSFIENVKATKKVILETLESDYEKKCLLKTVNIKEEVMKSLHSEYHGGGMISNLPEKISETVVTNIVRQELLLVKESQIELFLARMTEELERTPPTSFDDLSMMLTEDFFHRHNVYSATQTREVFVEKIREHFNLCEGE
ncbi:MAG: hypothetical protein HN411_05505 [Waddliaceae bacterium]|nr:hypothetical protein [Waddliaceae bacterium]MBT7263970.1 hypothetical protein [Waddliaceae bacterium]